MEKPCFKCGSSKPLSAFYKHPKMRDGHLNKCKECTKLDVLLRYRDPAARQRIAAYERERFQTPGRKQKVLEYQRRRRQRDPQKDKARQALHQKLRSGQVHRRPCEICGKQGEAHHLDYSRPLNVRWLCFAHHRAAHGQTVIA